MPMRVCCLRILMFTSFCCCLVGCSESQDERRTREVIQWLKAYPTTYPHESYDDSKPSPYASLDEWDEAGREIEGIENVLIRLARTDNLWDITHINKSGIMYCLGIVGSGDSVPVLIEMMEDPAQGFWTRAHAAVSLGAIGDRRAVVPLCRLVLCPGENRRLKLNATLGLRLMGDPDAIPVLEKALKEGHFSQSARRSILKTLEELKQK